MKDSSQEDHKEKDNIFYSAMINAWLTTKIELDKKMLGLSVVFIGLIITLETIFYLSDLKLILFAFALVMFLITTISVVFIMNRNATYIEKLLLSNKTEDNLLVLLDKTAQFSFVLGMITIVISFCS